MPAASTSSGRPRKQRSWTPASLVQFHFHLPSEHTVDGAASPMEVHFVHAAEEGDLAVNRRLHAGRRCRPDDPEPLGGDSRPG
ncbi:carbonic anhydrase family protein [Candidatus Palauibacter sp.]|uniref:carbonic anhydrase family protein n=1 Tax=Candidatus Palauibacter sp. TaxID=3101350 RepID=UPI003B5A7959